MSQLAGSVGELAAYHHGDAALMETIVGMAQNHIGTNNLNLLLPNGQFGTRLQGGKDAASPRYLFTQLNPVTRTLFPAVDDHFLRHRHDLEQIIEPEWYCPVVPLILINGVDGTGTGWMSRIPNYNPNDVIDNIKRLIKKQDIVPMTPWFKHFNGTMYKLDDRRYISYGVINKINNSSVEITELPVRTWTATYKENVRILKLYYRSSIQPSIRSAAFTKKNSSFLRINRLGPRTNAKSQPYRVI